jgi:hypothetical protein
MIYHMNVPGDGMKKRGYFVGVSYGIEGGEVCMQILRGV